MMNIYLSSINYWAVFIAGLAYWILGAIWFSAIFGNMWGSELEKHGVKIKQPTKAEMFTKLLVTFALNLVVAFGVSLIVFLTNPATIRVAIKLGLFVGICFSAATICIAYNWEGKSLKLSLIDCGYSIVGIIVCTVIISHWR